MEASSYFLYWIVAQCQMTGWEFELERHYPCISPQDHHHQDQNQHHWAFDHVWFPIISFISFIKIEINSYQKVIDSYKAHRTNRRIHSSSHSSSTSSSVPHIDHGRWWRSSWRSIARLNLVSQYSPFDLANKTLEELRTSSLKMLSIHAIQICNKGLVLSKKRHRASKRSSRGR